MRTSEMTVSYDYCDCGRAVYDGRVPCRRCRRQQDSQRRRLRLVKERRRGEREYGRV